MDHFANRKLVENIFKNSEDIEEVGENYKSLSDDDDSVLMAPTSKNILILANGFYDKKNTLLILCLLSCIVYRNDNPYEEVCKAWGLPIDSIKTPDDQLVYGSFMISNKLVITFKGSSSKRDYLTDIDLIPIDD